MSEDWKNIKTICATDNSYSKHKESVCKVCSSTRNLSVHHGFPQDAIKHFNIEVIKVNTLHTLCEPCHSAYEKEASNVKFKLSLTNPKCRGYDKASNYLARLKNKTQKSKMTKPDIDIALEFLSIYTGKYICMSNLPDNIREFKESVYTGFDIKTIEKMWKHHFSSWMEIEKLLFTKK